MYRTLFVLAATAVLSGQALALNLFRNAGFESATEGVYAQGILPHDWVASSLSPDTYSNDGSYGLFPYEYNNFTGVTAHGGKRWVAGGVLENFYQVLDASLVAGQTYEIKAWLHQALRADLNTPAGTDIALGDGPTVAHLGDTVSFEAGWNQFRATFVAASAESVVHFRTTSGYPGVDDVELTAVPEPATIAWLLAGMGVLLRRRGR